jgi:hypothetical protein
LENRFTSMDRIYFLFLVDFNVLAGRFVLTYILHSL